DRGSFAADLVFYVAPSGTAGTTVNEKMRITSEGNVGIGTAVPDVNARLTVNGNTLIQGNVRSSSATVGVWDNTGVSQVISGYITGAQNTPPNAAPFAPYVTLIGGSTWWNLGNINGVFQIYSGGASNSPTTSVLSIDNITGNFRIGNPSSNSTAAACKLFVNGKIGATEVVVSTTDWSDYVFDESYKLPSLEEVDAYIKTNKHLPAVPSEKEVVENGVNTGEMLKTHMRKIEELTLYVIELKKEIEAMKK
ncbi:MAG: hypothetical protein K2Q22_13230, partial [Cytophagales bacterium]|nr:hypothetical protein [Cytophagales bacterium]